MDRYQIGIANGRFQILHMGHMEYLLACKERCEHLIIGITDPDPTRSFFEPDIDSEDPREPFRSVSYPFYTFTFYERALMIKESLLEAGIDRTSFEIVPFPIHFPKLLKYYIPMDAVVFVTIYDDWGYKKVDILKSLGLQVEILWVRDMSERFTTGTEVRELIANSSKWEHFVPHGVVRVIRKLKLEEKLKRLGNG
ncbi:MAG: adenylyltransferase/cytidyltransferase family protein [Nitrospirota bacterium]